MKVLKYLIQNSMVVSHASVVGANCLGHIFGIGAILGLASRGVL